MKYYTDTETKRLIDIELEKNAKVQAALGTDSTDEERSRANKLWNEYYLPRIKELDSEFAQVVEPT